MSERGAPAMTACYACFAIPIREERRGRYLAFTTLLYVADEYGTVFAACGWRLVMN